MLMPEFMYGLSKDVKRHSNKIVNKLKKGISWEEAVEGPMVKTSEKEGLIVLYGPNPLIGGLECFNVYWLLDRYFEVMFDFYGNVDEYNRASDLIFEKCLETEWGVLSLFAKRNSRWFTQKPHRFIPFLKALENYWDTFISEGARYSTGNNIGSPIWNIPSSLRYVLANMNVSDEDRHVTLGEKGLKFVIDKYRFY